MYKAFKILAITELINDCFEGNRSGFTINSCLNAPESGYMVGTGKLEKHAVKGDDVEEYVSQVLIEMSTNNNIYLGGWMHNGKLIMEIASNFQNKGLATAFGLIKNQKAIWDVKNNQDINL